MRAPLPTTDALFAQEVEQKMSNLLAGFGAVQSFLDRTNIAPRRSLQLLNFSRRIRVRIRPAWVRRFELRCDAGPPLGAPPAIWAAIRKQSGLAEKMILPGDRDRLGCVTQIRVRATCQRDEFSLCTSKFESDHPSHAVGLADVAKCNSVLSVSLLFIGDDRLSVRCLPHRICTKSALCRWRPMPADPASVPTMAGRANRATCSRTFSGTAPTWASSSETKPRPMPTAIAQDCHPSAAVR